MSDEPPFLKILSRMRRDINSVLIRLETAEANVATLMKERPKPGYWDECEEEAEDKLFSIVQDQNKEIVRLRKRLATLQGIREDQDKQIEHLQRMVGSAAYVLP